MWLFSWVFFLFLHLRDLLFYFKHSLKKWFVPEIFLPPFLFSWQGFFEYSRSVEIMQKLTISATLKMGSGLKNQFDIWNFELTASEKFVIRFYLWRHLQGMFFYWKLVFLWNVSKKIRNLRPFRKSKINATVFIIIYDTSPIMFQILGKFRDHPTIWPSNLGSKICQNLAWDLDSTFLPFYLFKFSNFQLWPKNFSTTTLIYYSKFLVGMFTYIFCCFAKFCAFIFSGFGFMV